MGKLHELLAVESDIKDVFGKIIDETTKTFNQRSEHFQETRKTYNPLNPEDKDLPDEEFKPMATTVVDKLNYSQEAFVRMIDAVLQKERANQNACADIIVTMPDGTLKTLLTNAPVVFLVQMENILSRIRSVYNEIPTLEPAKSWEKDTTQYGVWKAEPFIRVRTKKIPTPLVKYQATKEHPAQTEIINLDEVVGKWNQTSRSGALSPKQKSQLLDHFDRLIAAVKIARAKANDREIETAIVGIQFFNYINEDVEF